MREVVISGWLAAHINSVGCMNSLQTASNKPDSLVRCEQVATSTEVTVVILHDIIIIIEYCCRSFDWSAPGKKFWYVGGAGVMQGHKIRNRPIWEHSTPRVWLSICTMRVRSLSYTQASVLS